MFLYVIYFYSDVLYSNFYMLVRNKQINQIEKILLIILSLRPPTGQLGDVRAGKRARQRRGSPQESHGRVEVCGPAQRSAQGRGGGCSTGS